MARRRPSFTSDRYLRALTSAGAEIRSGIERAALITDHHPTSGGVREGGLRGFLRKLLPDSYYVGSGFAFDAKDTQSKQLDVVVALQPPLTGLFEDDETCLLPCEVVLAAVEVKKVLNAAEVIKVLENAASLRSLRPFGTQRFVAARKGGQSLDAQDHRCFYGVVAVGSDLALDGWSQREWDRIRQLADKAEVSVEVVDRLAILDRGLLNTAEGRVYDEGETMEQLISMWFLHLSNFLDREAERRPPFDPDIYAPGGKWTKLD